MTISLRPRVWIPTMLLAVFASAGLTGCATTGAATPRQPTFRIVNGATYVPVPTAQDEYAKEAATLQLPAQHSWPQHPMRASEGGTPDWYQVGYGRQAADRFWFCSWASVAVGTADAKLRHDAVETLQGMLRLYYYTVALDAPSRPQPATELATAQRGNLAALSNDLQRNC
jgi:hypothetical protein